MDYNFDEVINRYNTACVKYDLRNHFFGTDDIIPMWVADMDFKVPEPITEAIIKRASHEILGYSIRTETFSAAIKHWMQAQHSWDIQKEWIVFSPGVVPALNFIILALTNPEDVIVIQPPVYFPFFGAIKDNGRILSESNLITEKNQMFIDFDDLELKLRNGAKMLILCSPHNPGGRVWTHDELTRIGNLCLENNVLVLSDEIHSDLVFHPNRHIPFASISDEIASITITANAPSKTFNTAGLSTSYLIIPNPELREKVRKTIDNLHVSLGNIFGTVALEAAYNHCYPWLSALLDYLKANIDYTKEFVETKLPGIKMIQPEATYLIWLDCRDLGLTDDDLKAFFINKAKVGLNPGLDFGAPGSGFMRLNVACPRSLLETVLNRIQVALMGL